MNPPVETKHLMSGISPNTLYFMALYTIVILVRFFKLKKESTRKWTGTDVKKVFHVALEIVYTASGLVVLLLADLKDYTPFIIIAYLIIFYICSQMESISEKFSENTVTVTHIVILIFVVSLTCWYFEAGQKHTLPIEGKKESVTAQYEVAIPYIDMALRQHLGASANSLNLVYLTKVTAKNESEAKILARKKADSELKPYATKNAMSAEGAIIFRDELYANKIEEVPQ